MMAKFMQQRNADLLSKILIAGGRSENASTVQVNGLRKNASILDTLFGEGDACVQAAEPVRSCIQFGEDGIRRLIFKNDRDAFDELVD